MLDSLKRFGEKIFRPKEPVADKITILSEQPPEVRQQTWGETKKRLETAQVDEYLLEVNIWDFAGQLGDIEGPARLREYGDGSRNWTDGNSSYLSHLQERYELWQGENPAERQGVELTWVTSFSGGRADKRAETKIRLVPVDDTITIERLAKAATEFKAKANEQLRDIYGGFEL